MYPFTAYASVVNEASEIRGFASAGVPIGASASKLREAAIQELLCVNGPVFLDSGAFSEVSFSSKTARLEVSNPGSRKQEAGSQGAGSREWQTKACMGNSSRTQPCHPERSRRNLRLHLLLSVLFNPTHNPSFRPEAAHFAAAAEKPASLPIRSPGPHL